MLSRILLQQSSKVARSSHASIHTSAKQQAKVLVALYADPKTGYPPKYARDSIPTITKYDHPLFPDATTTPTPESELSWTPGELLGCVSGELGLRKFLEDRGHTLVVTSDKDGEDSVFEKEIVDADVVISQPFWPAYITAERFEKAKNLKLVMTAGIGSDHVDLEAANKHNATVTEVTFCNSISVAEHVCMQILALVRNYIPSYKTIVDGGWNIADCVSRAYDVEGMSLGTVAAGRIGLAVLRRMAPFDMKLHYTDRHRLPAHVEEELNLTFHETAEEMYPHCDVVTLNCPLHPETEHMINDETLKSFKRGTYIVNTARGKLVERESIVKALEDGHIAGYAGDVWFPQPPPKDHPWRTMPNHAMTPHTSGTVLSAQHRYSAGVVETLECFFDNKPIRDEYLICQNGALAGVGAHSYSDGNATGGSSEAEKFGGAQGNV
jgi:formate dehydrogenase